MSRTSQDLSPPQKYLQRIDEALQHRQEIAKQLKSIRSASEAKGFRPDIDAFILALENELDAKDFVKEGAYGAWLSAILEWKQCRKEDSQISQLATAVSRKADIRWTRSHNLSYIGFLLFALFSMFVFLCGTVIPVFAEMFKEFELRLPAPTLFLVWFGSWIGPKARQIFLIFIASLVMIWLGKRILRHLSHMKYIATFGQRFSIGCTSSVVAMSRCLAALSSLLKIDAPLREALIIAGRASQSEILVQHAVRLANELASLPVEQCPSRKAFPPIVIDSLRENGLTRGDRLCTADLLRELGIIYGERARHRHAWMLRFFLPLTLILIGGIFGFVILALFLPLISLTTSLSGGY